jgi:hypothetical protein
LHDLLSRVAAGELDPAEAGRLLDEDPSLPTVDRVPRTPSPAAVLLRAGGVRLTVVADPTVATVVVDGPHAMHHDGTTTVIEAPGSSGYRTQPPPRLLGWVPAEWTGGRGERVSVRVRPDLPLTVEATGCGVQISGMTGEVTIGGSGSSVKVIDHRGAVHGGLTMGSLTVVGAITGPSELDCELSSLQLRLTPGSDVALAATAEMGSLKIAGATRSRQIHADGGARQSITAGAGTHPFAVTVRMGSATVVVAT